MLFNYVNFCYEIKLTLRIHKAVEINVHYL